MKTRSTKMQKKITRLTTREVIVGLTNEQRRERAERLGFVKPRPKRRLGGVSDLDIERMENMTPEQIEEMEVWE